MSFAPTLHNDENSLIFSAPALPRALKIEVFSDLLIFILLFNLFLNNKINRLNILNHNFNNLELFNYLIYLINKLIKKDNFHLIK